MRSILFILFLTSSSLFFVSAEDEPHPSTAAPIDDSTPVPATNEAESTPAAPVQKVDAISLPAEPKKEEEIGSTAPPKEDAESTPAKLNGGTPSTEEEEEDEEEEEGSTPAPGEKAKDSTPDSEVKVEVATTPAPEKKEEVAPTVAPIQVEPKKEEEVHSTVAPKVDESTPAPAEKKDAEVAVAPVAKVEKEEEEEEEDEDDEESASVLLEQILETGGPVEIDELKEVKIAVPDEVKTEVSDGEPTKEEKKDKKLIKFVRPATGANEDLFKKFVKKVVSEGEADTKEEKKDDKLIKFVRPASGENGDLFKNFIKPALEKLRSGKAATLTKADFAKMKPSFDSLRAGRALINIERIDKIDVTVHTYAKKK